MQGSAARENDGRGWKQAERQAGATAEQEAGRQAGGVHVTGNRGVVVVWLLRADSNCNAYAACSGAVR
jgi:hypothetical protein